MTKTSLSSNQLIDKADSKGSDVDKPPKLGTKKKLLEAAISVFGTRGYSGGSVRQIADLADTSIAAIKYHYSSKELLWKAVVDHLYTQLSHAILQESEEWPSMSQHERTINSTRNYIYFCAKHPELNRIIFAETIENGERMEWLAENHMRLFAERSLAWTAICQEDGVYPKDAAVLNMFFISTSVAQNIFLMAPFIKHTFNIDVFEPEQIEKHVDAVLKVLITSPEKELGKSADK